MSERNVCITEDGRIFDLAPMSEGRDMLEFIDGVWVEGGPNIKMGEILDARVLSPEEIDFLEKHGKLHP